MLLLPETSLKRIIIIGGGFGGIEFAKHIDDTLYQVVMVDKNNYHTFQPLLYQVATGGLEPDSIAYPIRKIFQHKKNFIFRVTEVVRVVPEEKKIITTLGEMNFDMLVIATGSTTNFFGNNLVEKNAMPLKSMTDALNLRSLLLQNLEKLLTEKDAVAREKLSNIIIIGAGPTGVEIAGALAELKRHVLPKDYRELNMEALHIYIVEASGKVLGNLSRVAQNKAKTFLLNMQVQVLLNTKLDRFEDDVVYLSTGKHIYSSNVIWTAGVKGNPVTGMDASHLAATERIRVDRYNRLIGCDGIFAIGDVCAMQREGESFHPQVAPVAMQQAKNLARNLNAKKGTWKAFTYKDMGSMATIGRNKAVADLGRFRFQGAFAWLIWMAVHLMSIVGFRNRLVVFINWIWNYFSYDRAIRLIIRPYKRP